MSPKQYATGSSPTRATYVSASINADESYSNAILIAHASGVNIGSGSCSVSGVSDSEILYTLSGGSYLSGFVVRFSCSLGSTIVTTISHDNTGGGTSFVSVLLMA